MYRKDVIRDPETGGWAMYLDGELIGFAKTEADAWQTLDALVFELMSGQYFRESA